MKFCIVGSEGTGKTNIRRIITGKRFKRNVSPTIGSDFSFKEVYSDEIIIQSMIWDLSGNGKYKNSRSLYLQGIQGGLLVFDITDENSFLELEEWVTDIEQSTANRGGIPLIILANKTDLIPISESTVNENQIVEFVNSLRERFKFKFEINYIFTSASTGENIDEAFLQLISNVQNLLDNRKIQ
ncbi:MAG: GTP-binding protein [Candidatus Heimdallarchaeota archaeon]|nr:GTP-binding protein [Candidatus Heimdallarchaeota archaeon]